MSGALIIHIKPLIFLNFLLNPSSVASHFFFFFFFFFYKISASPAMKYKW